MQLLLHIAYKMKCVSRCIDDIIAINASGEFRIVLEQKINMEVGLKYGNGKFKDGFNDDNKHV